MKRGFLAGMFDLAIFGPGPVHPTWMSSYALNHLYGHSLYGPNLYGQ